MEDYTAADYQKAWNDWHEKYEIGEYIDYSESSWDRVQKMDPHFVWTSHGTCEDNEITSGARLYNGSCCWTTHGWYIANVPWSGDPDDTYESIKSDIYLPCESCNADGEEEDIDPECELCEGEGYVHHYFD